MKLFTLPSTTLLRIGSVIGFGVLLSLSSHTSHAADGFSNFWLSPTAKQSSRAATVKSVQVQSSLVSKLADRSKFAFDKEQIVSNFINHDNGKTGFTLASNYSLNEYSVAMGARFGALSLYTNSGSGDSYSHNASAYHGLDPYAFHGGNHVDYRYQGAAFGYAFDDSDLQLGQTTVRARGLEDRTASYIDFSKNRFFARYTHIERGSDSVGYGIDAGVNLGKFNLGFQRVANRSDVSTQRIRLNWNKDTKNRFWFDLSKHQNALLSDYNDTRGMITWQHAFGGNKFTSSLDESGPKKRSKRSTARRGILIGGAAAAGAILASSGNKSQDNAVRIAPKLQENRQPDPAATNTSTDLLAANITAQHAAAKSKLNEVNPLSTAANKEYGGYVYQAADGSYAATEAVIGDNSSVALPDKVSAVPAGTTARASYHTHAAFDPAFDSEFFSEADLEGDRFDEIDGYLATPQGAFKYHEVTTGKITTLGTVDK